jgi:predicted AAA+ superfamily ATPase
LEETFLVKRVVPFFTNKNKEISKAPKIYFVDNGVRNYFIKNFIEDVDLRVDNGVLFE